jgi:hypothetical protein
MIMNTVKEMKSANLKNMLFKGILSSTLAYFTIRIYMVFLRNLWVYGNQYSAFVSCIPILGSRRSPSLHSRHRLLLHRLRRVDHGHRETDQEGLHAAVQQLLPSLIA